MSNIQPLNKSILVPDDRYVTDVLLLCTVCREPIKARINTPNWLRVEWIGPSGECQRCYQQAKETDDGTVKRG